MTAKKLEKRKRNSHDTRSSVPEHPFPALPSSPDDLRVLGFPARLIRLEQLVAHLCLVLAVCGGACVWAGAGEKRAKHGRTSDRGCRTLNAGSGRPRARFGDRGGGPRTRQSLLRHLRASRYPHEFRHPRRLHPHGAARSAERRGADPAPSARRRSSSIPKTKRRVVEFSSS